MVESSPEERPISLPPEARCPKHGALLQADAPKSSLEGAVRGTCGCVFPVRLGIPRFVSDGGYASAFGLQWNAFRRTQLDSSSGTTISRDRLTRCLGGSLEPLRGASVLEVGCGAGRFTEVLLEAGARVLACDLSAAVEANQANCGGHPGYFVCQADVMSLPIAPGAFDYVVALGMVQHTPSPEHTIAALAVAVRPGGLLVLDHYRALSPLIKVLSPLTPKTMLRAILLRLPPPLAFRVTEAIVRTLLPVHRALWRRGPVVDRVRAVWRLTSPVFDYYDAFPQLGEALADWARLDTHDGLTDYYKHRRTPQEVARALTAVGLEVIDSRAGGNGVEARARRPADPAAHSRGIHERIA
jgi:SAM-dependent methyltransferase